MTTYGFKQLIVDATHILPQSLSCIDLIFTDQLNYVMTYFVRELQPPPPPHFLGHPHLTQLAPPPLSKIFVFPPLFSIPPRYSDVSHRPHAAPFFLSPTHQPSSHIINRFKQISKGWLYQFNHRFLKKPRIFNFLNLLTNISGYLDSWDIFRFIFRP